MRSIFETRDYGMFLLSGLQRNFNKTKMNAIKYAISFKDLQNPIVVNEKLQILDGYHTFLARKELRLPIYYWILEGGGELEIRMFNFIRNNWKLTDLIKSYKDNELIKPYADAILKHKLGNTIIMLFLYDKITMNTNDFRYDLMTHNVTKWTNINEFNKRVSLYVKYSGFVKNRIFYKILIDNPKLDCIEMLQAMNWKPFITGIKSLQSESIMKDAIIDYMKKSGVKL